MQRQRSSVRDLFGDSAAPSISTDRISQASDTPSIETQGPPRRRFVSYRLKGEYERPWLDDKRLKRNWVGNWIVRGFFFVGLILSGYINYNATKRIEKHEYCLVMEDDFNTFDRTLWNREVQVGDWGTGEFEWTTTDSRNIFVDADGLHLVPTTTTNSTNVTPAQIDNGYTLNLTKAGGDGSCTGTSNSQCSVHSNSTLNVIIPPVRSARINTKGKKSTKYGRVEVVAKMPAGDWLWPAIWLLPVNDTYGPWPASGEIDIAESRGNDVTYEDGRDTVSSTLHWGPAPALDAFWRSSNIQKIRRTDFTKGFHTYGLEWSEDYLFTWIDSPLHQVIYYRFPTGGTLWQTGGFANDAVNQSLLTDPWASTGGSNTPFDQPFYLIFDVAVGSTNGFFPEGVGNKPWSDSGNAASDFYKAIDTWLPTWGQGNDRGMTVKSVKMWQQGACGAPN